MAQSENGRTASWMPLSTLFAEKGFAETSLRLNHQQGQVSPGAVNYHFGFQEGLEFRPCS